MPRPVLSLVLTTSLLAFGPGLEAVELRAAEAGEEPGFAGRIGTPGPATPHKTVYGRTARSSGGAAAMFGMAQAGQAAEETDRAKPAAANPDEELDDPADDDVGSDDDDFDGETRDAEDGREDSVEPLPQAAPPPERLTDLIPDSAVDNAADWALSPGESAGEPVEVAELPDPGLPDADFVEAPVLPGEDPSQSAGFEDSFSDDDFASEDGSAPLSPPGPIDVDRALEQLAIPLPDPLEPEADVPSFADIEAPDLEQLPELEIFKVSDELILAFPADSDAFPEETDFVERFKALSAIEALDTKEDTVPQLAARARSDEELLVEVLRTYGYYDGEIIRQLSGGRRGLAEVEEEDEQRVAAEDPQVRFDILPGPRYRYGAINLGQFDNLPDPDQTALRTVFGIQVGDPLYSDRIVEEENELRAALAESGYPFSEVDEPSLLIDHAREEGDLTLPVQPGGKYVFGDVVSSDPDFLSGRHLGRIARFDDGEIYQASLQSDLRRAILATGLVSSAVVTPREIVPPSDGEPGVVALDVALEKAPLRTISGAIGYGTEDGFKLQAGWEHRNLFPPEGALQLRGIIGTREQLASVGFRRNNFRDRDQVLSLDAYASDIQTQAVDAKTIGFRGSFERVSNLLFQKPLSWLIGSEVLYTDERTRTVNDLQAATADLPDRQRVRQRDDRCERRPARSHHWVPPDRVRRTRIFPFGRRERLLSARAGRCELLPPAWQHGAGRPHARGDDPGRTGVRDRAVAAAVFGRRRIGARLRVPGHRPAQRIRRGAGRWIAGRSGGRGAHPDRPDGRRSRSRAVRRRRLGRARCAPRLQRDPARCRDRDAVQDQLRPDPRRCRRTDQPTPGRCAGRGLCQPRAGVLMAVAEPSELVIDDTPIVDPKRRGRGRRWAKRLGWTLAIIVTPLILLAAFLTSPIGKRFIADQIAQVAPASGLRFEVGRIEGDIYNEAVLHDVVLSDPKGVFARIPLVELDWRPLAWLWSGLDVRELSIRRASLERLPELLPGDPDAPLLPDFDIRIDRFEVENLMIARGIAGDSAQRVDLLGEVDIREGRALVDAEGRLGPEDRFDLLLDVEPEDDKFDLAFDYRAAKDGPIAAIAGLDAAYRARIEGEGTWSRWLGHAFVAKQVGSGEDARRQRVAAFRIANRAGRYGIVGQYYPLLDDGSIVDRALGDAVSLKLAGTFADSVLDGRVQALSSAFAISAGGVVDLADNEADDVEVLAVLRDPDLLGDTARFEGTRFAATIDGEFRDLTVDHRLSVERLSVGDAVTARGLVQDGTATYDGTRFVLPLDARVARVVSGSNYVDPRLKGGTLRGTLTYTGDRLLTDQVRIAFPGLDARLTLRGDLGTGKYAIAGPIEARGIAIPDVGRVSGRGDIRLGFGGEVPYTLAAEVRGRLSGVTNATVANLAVRAGGLLRCAQDGGQPSDRARRDRHRQRPARCPARQPDRERAHDPRG